MNCERGDLAIVVGGRLVGFERRLVGTIVRVTEPYPSPDAARGPAWMYEGQPLKVIHEGCLWTVVAICDASLRPLRPPGDEDDVFRLEPLPGELIPA